MNLTIRNAGIPTLLSDWINSDFFGPDLTDVDFHNGKRLGVTIPSANIIETDKDYRIELAAPGLKRNDFKVEYDKNILTVSAEKKEEKSEKDENYSRKEYCYHSFCRSFALPTGIKDEKIEAKYEDGELRIHLPKKEATPSKSRKEIAIV